MGSIWKPTVQFEPYRGNIQSHRDFWTPTQSHELYHYGRKGMKWYQHIFGNINLKAMGTGVGNLLDEDKIKEIARKLGIPLNQIDQKMGIIREYFMKERQQQIGTSNPPAYEKTQRDAREIKKVADSIRRDVSTRNWERASQDIALEKRRLGQLDEYNHRFDPPEVKQKNSGTVPVKVLKKGEYSKMLDERQAREDERRSRERSERLHAEYVANHRAERERKEREAKWREEHQISEEDKKFMERTHDTYMREQAKKEKRKRDQEFMEELEEEQRRREEEEYEKWKKYLKKGSGGGHSF